MIGNDLVGSCRDNILRASDGDCREGISLTASVKVVRGLGNLDYVFGLARNRRLRKIIGTEMQQARVQHQSSGKAARVFAEFSCITRKSWSRPRRVVAKAEYLDKGENPRFVVTSLVPDPWSGQSLYEKFYCFGLVRLTGRMHSFSWAKP